MKPLHPVGPLAAGLVVGFAIGSSFFGGSSKESAELEACRQAVESARFRAERAETELASAREPRRRPRDNPNPNEPPGLIPGGSRAPHESGMAPKEAPAKPGALGPEARAKRVNEIRAGLASIFQNHEGDKALAALKELAALAPEGRDDAMRLALDINKDVEGTGALRLPMQTFYMGLGDPAIRDLMFWSLENQASTTPDFRVLAAWSLPWAQTPIDETISRFDAALAHESDQAVQKAIVDNLGQINSPKAEAALVRVLGDATRGAALHADAAMALASSDDPAVQRAIAAAAAADSTNARLQTAAKVSLIVRDPPATGCLVVATSSGGNAEFAGLRAGDVIVSYNGRVVATEIDLRNEAKQATGAEPVPLVVVRDGVQQTLQVKPARIDRGAALKPVEKK